MCLLLRCTSSPVSFKEIFLCYSNAWKISFIPKESLVMLLKESNRKMVVFSSIAFYLAVFNGIPWCMCKNYIIRVWSG